MTRTFKRPGTDVPQALHERLIALAHLIQVNQIGGKEKLRPFDHSVSVSLIAAKPLDDIVRVDWDGWIEDAKLPTLIYTSDVDPLVLK